MHSSGRSSASTAAAADAEEVLLTHIDNKNRVFSQSSFTLLSLPQTLLIYLFILLLQFFVSHLLSHLSTTPDTYHFTDTLSSLIDFSPSDFDLFHMIFSAAADAFPFPSPLLDPLYTTTRLRRTLLGTFTFTSSSSSHNYNHKS